MNLRPHLASPKEEKSVDSVLMERQNAYQSVSSLIGLDESTRQPDLEMEANHDD
jgi:shikimate kinase